jgi:hypothetical protein
VELARLIPRPHQAAVFFFAGVVLLSETVLFHVTRFIVDYTLAMTVIGCAVAGIGLGALLASRLQCVEADIFGWCCGGTTASLYLAALVLLQQPRLLFLLPSAAAVFVFPSTFIARAFARSDSRGVYFFDMLGAGVAVAATALLYQRYSSETIFLGLVTAIPLTGSIWSCLLATHGPRRRLWDGLWLLLLASVGGAFLTQQVQSDSMNIVRLVNPQAPNIPAQSVLRRPSRMSITRTYDSLLGRVDVIPSGNRTFVTYDGFFNDNFYNDPPEDYLDYAKPHGLRFPQVDRRVVYGLVPEPQVFVIGAAADGILKTLREITPLDHIDAVEVNPGILQMMQRDFVEESGRVYEGLNVQSGNATSILKHRQHKYDIITLINTHSSRWIGALGPPDYLHTRESYDLYLDRLTEDGYLLFEERPDTRRGELGVKRMILTLYDCLQRRGIENPAEHFFVWEYMSNRFYERGGTGVETGSDMYYVGMVVSLKPFRGQRRQNLLDWCKMEWMVLWNEQKQPIHYPRVHRPHPAYLLGKWHGERFGPFFDMIAERNFSALDPDFDSSIVTQDQPFPSCSRRSMPTIGRMVRVTSAVCCVLGGLIALGALRPARYRRQTALLVVYNIAIGGAYFFVEIMLIQAYQEVFLSPSLSLVLVLGILLIGSGIGGLTAERISPALATLALGPVLFAALRAPAWIVASGLPLPESNIIASCVVLLVGMNMGIYFPSGLIMARRWALRSRIPHLFAINAVAGSWATILSFYLGIRVGYAWTMTIALALYVLSVIVYQFCRRGRPLVRHKYSGGDALHQAAKSKL